MILAAAGLATASVASAAPPPARVDAPVASADDIRGEHASQAMVGLILIAIMIAVITLGNNGDGSVSP
jgi:hypothetical protein